MSDNENKDVKNQEDPPNPLNKEDILKLLKSQDKPRNIPNLPIELMVMLTGESSPQVEINLVTPDDGKTAATKDTDTYEIKLTIQNPALGVHTFPPSIQISKIIPQKDQKVNQTDVYLPDHLPFRPLPDPLTKELNVSTVFTPDNRKVFNDTSFPWSTVGRVETSKGVGSGVMVGPRHLLTAGHMIKWNSDGTADFLKFTPAYYDGSTTAYGQAFATNIYIPEGITVNDADGMNDNELRHDFVVVVLNTRIGEVTGYMGSKIWYKGWNDIPYWIHVGYSQDLTSGQKPTYQTDTALTGDDDSGHILFNHKADIYKGHSGGPFFGYWDSKPYVMAIQSSEQPDINYACGSEHMVQLIEKARIDFP